MLTLMSLVFSRLELFTILVMFWTKLGRHCNVVKQAYHQTQIEHTLNKNIKKMIEKWPKCVSLFSKFLYLWYNALMYTCMSKEKRDLANLDNI